MLFQQFYLKCLAHASYVVGDETTGVAAVVDPQRDVGQYEEYASEHGLRIAHVILTHLHADFIAGHLELRNRTGATIYLGRAATAEYAFTPLSTNDVVEFGKVRLKALETPGHTPEGISILVYDRAVSETTPYGVLTGDTLFIGDVGRPDLRAALGWKATDLGALLYDSLHEKLLPLPDATRVFPAHGAGSLCGKAISQERVSTMGEQRRSNYALQPMSKPKFIDLVTADQPDAPPYFTYDAVMNTKERPTLDEALARELRPIGLDTLLDAQSRGAQVLDTREPDQFAAAHLAGSVNIGLGGEYATWAGTVLRREAPIVIVAEPGAEHESAMRLGRIGFDQVAGFLDGGLASADRRPDLIRSIERLSPERAAERLAESAPPLVIDVRTPPEHAERHIPGATNIPLNQLQDRLAEIPAGRPVLVHCAGGYRSSIAASLLQRAGREAVGEIAGGITAWDAAGLPYNRRKGGE